MSTYESVEEPDEWRTTNTLELSADGTFRFSAVSACYAGSVESEVSGTWKRREKTLVLLAEESTHSLWPAGEARTAFVDGDEIDVGGIGLFLPLRQTGIR